MFELIRVVRRRIDVLRRIRERERSMADEMGFHVDMEARELERAGFSPEEARRLAHVAFGGVERFKERGRDARGTRLIEDLLQDGAYAWRQLRARPAFTASVVLTLALGIGTTTMMLGGRRLDVAELAAVDRPESVVYVGRGPADCPRCASIDLATYAALRAGTRSFRHLAAIAEWEPALRGGESTELADGQRVTPEFFETLGITPMMGRTFLPEDAEADRDPVVVLTERAWRLRLGSDPDVVGHVLVLDRVPHTIVGVVSDRRVYPRDTELWAPIHGTPGEAQQGTEYRALGRLRAGASIEALRAELVAIGARAGLEVSDVPSAVLTAGPLTDLHRPPSDTATWTYLGATALVMAVACFNLAGLLLARLTTRRRELAFRRALGASPARIVRQLLTEIVLVTVIAGACGIPVAVWGDRMLLGGTGLPLDLPVVAMTIGLGVATGLLIGAWPAVRCVLTVRTDDLRLPPSPPSWRRHALIVAQMTLTVVALSVAAMLARSFTNIRALEPGFDPDRLVVLRVQNPDGSSPGADGAWVDRVITALAGVEGVERAGATVGVPFGHGASLARFAIDGPEDEGSVVEPRARMHAVSPGYFATLGLPLLRGRTFGDADQAGAPRVAIVNRALVDRDFGGRDPIGRSLLMDGEPWQIVGVIRSPFDGDVEQLGQAEIYRPLGQWRRSLLWIVVRTRGASTDLGGRMTEAIRKVDPDIAITRLLTMHALRDADMGSERRMLRSMTAFGVGALLISTIGLYGLVSHSVGQRSREFGVRIAVGSGRGALFRLVLGQGMRLTLLASGLGIVGALGAAGALRSILFGVAPSDPVPIGVGVLVISAVSLVACCVPAHRAARADPVASMRPE